MHFNKLTGMLNLALKSSNPTVAAECLLDSIRNSDAKPIDGPTLDLHLSELPCSESDGHLFFILSRSHYLGDVDGREDFAKAARYLRAAYAQGYNSAAFYLANLYYYGTGVKLNYRSALEFYSVGAKIHVLHPTIYFKK